MAIRRTAMRGTDRKHDRVLHVYVVLIIEESWLRVVSFRLLRTIFANYRQDMILRLLLWNILVLSAELSAKGKDDKEEASPLFVHRERQGLAFVLVRGWNEWKSIWKYTCTFRSVYSMYHETFSGASILSYIGLFLALFTYICVRVRWIS